MKLVSFEDYTQFFKDTRQVTIGEVAVNLKGEKEVERTSPSEDWKPETCNVWSFPDRGVWASHTGDYRGNWSPFIPRNLIMRYTKKGDTVLDQMMGSGTTLVESRLLGRNAIGVDINPNAVMVAQDRLSFRSVTGDRQRPTQVRTYIGDSRNLNEIEDQSIDLVATHPPYADIIPYSMEKQIRDDLSRIHDIDTFIEEMHNVASECYRVLKKGKNCAILVGDMRRNKLHVSLAFRTMQVFLDIGFILREDIIKYQWNTKSLRESWKGKNYDFLLLSYEHLFVFSKPA